MGSVQMIGLGFMYGPQTLVISLGWFHWKIEWKGEMRDHWPHTRPIRKGEIPKGALYDFSKHRGLNPHVKAASRNKYGYGAKKPPEAEGWLARLRKRLGLAKK